MRRSLGARICSGRSAISCDASGVRVAAGAEAVNNEAVEPRVTVADLQQRGLQPLTPVAETLFAAPFAVEAKDGKQYWLGLNNFYVITRYNRSINDALAVHELAQKLRAAKR